MQQSSLTIKEFDDIYDKEIIKRYEIHDRMVTQTKIYKKRKFSAIG
jgi:hypothetical protein